MQSRRGKGEGTKEGRMKMGKELPLRQPQLHFPRTRRETQHGECRGEDQRRGGSCCGMCPPGRTLPAVSSGEAWSSCGGRGRQGAPILLIQRRAAAISRGSVTAVSPGPALRLAAPARSTCSLRPRRSRCGMMQRRPAPSLRAGRGSEREAGRRTESARGEGEGPDGNLRRRLPPVRTAGAGGEAEKAGRVRGGTPARPGPARPAGRRMGVEAPEGGLGSWLSLRREPKLRKLPGIGAFLEEKQTVTSALVPGARAFSFRPPGLAAPFPVFCTQTLCFQSLLGAPRPTDTHTHTHTQGSCFRPFRLLRLPFCPFLSLSFTSALSK